MQIRRIYAALVATLGILTTILLSRHVSTDSPVVFGWSLSYGVTLGCLLLLSLCELIVVPSRCVRVLQSVLGCWSVSLVLLGAGLFWVSPASHKLRGDFSFHAEFLLPMLCLVVLLQVWLIYSKNAWFAVWGNSVAIALLVVLVFELPVVFAARKSYVYSDWGDRFTFAYLHQKVEPLIGSGGQLFPSRNLVLASLGESVARGVSFRTDSHGFRNSQELTAVKDETEYRILSLGDSFFGGFGVDQQRFVGALLEQRLNSKLGPVIGKRITVLNSQVADPANGLWYLQRWGRTHQPDLVVFGLFPGNDYFSSFLLAGFPDSLFLLGPDQRLALNTGFSFLAESTLASRILTSYPYRRVSSEMVGIESAFDYSALNSLSSRLPNHGFLHFQLPARIVGYQFRERSPYQGSMLPSWVGDHLESDGSKRLFDPSTAPWLYYRGAIVEREQIFSITFSLLNAQRNFVTELGIPYVLFSVPMRLQTQPLDWAIFRQVWGINEDDFDLLLPNSQLREFANRHAINLVDPITEFRLHAEKQNLYLASDLHWNERGHELAAKALEEYLVPLIKVQLGIRE